MQKYKNRALQISANNNWPSEGLFTPKRGDILAKVRRHLILAISEEYPHLSTTQLGKIFERDHSSIVVQRQRALKERADGDLPHTIHEIQTALRSNSRLVLRVDKKVRKRYEPRREKHYLD
jgi:hypothetical protein